MLGKSGCAEELVFLHAKREFIQQFVARDATVTTGSAVPFPSLCPSLRHEVILSDKKALLADRENGDVSCASFGYV